MQRRLSHPWEEDLALKDVGAARGVRASPVRLNLAAHFEAEHTGSAEASEHHKQGRAERLLNRIRGKRRAGAVHKMGGDGVLEAAPRSHTHIHARARPRAAG